MKSPPPHQLSYYRSNRSCISKHACTPTSSPSSIPPLSWDIHIIIFCGGLALPVLNALYGAFILTFNQGNWVQLVFKTFRGDFIPKAVNRDDRIQLVFGKLYDDFIF